MVQKKYTTVEGNTAAAHVAYAFSEVAAIYPITPSSSMGELADAWSAMGKKTIFGEPLTVVEMQSEAGAAGTIHGSLTAGSLTTTFTASQGLLLMLPNMFKIAGELLPTVFHVSSRSLACQSLSIFGDHSDVMAARTTGFAMLASSSVQEAHDMAIVAHLATLESRVPFIHFFDGFRTSHEIQKVELADYDVLKEMVNHDHIKRFKDASLLPEHPFSKVGAQNPDVYFQGRERANPFYNALPTMVKSALDKVEKTFGRKYALFDYFGAPDATKLIVCMGSGCETIQETVDYLTARGEKIGAIKVRLFRPFSVEDLRNAIPATVTKIAVLDRTKEPGSQGEPLFLDVATALRDKPHIKIIGGRYGLSSKEFTPSMVKGVYDHLDNPGFHGFTVGINDDLTHLSIAIKEEIHTEHSDVVRCKFWGFGSDGTVGANKNSIKIIGENTDKYVQGYFEYDSKKCGGVTISHLRFGDKPIQSQYLLTQSDFIGLHKVSYIGMYDILAGIKKGGIFLINAPWPASELFNHLTEKMQKTIVEKQVKIYAIDANKIAQEVGLGNKINSVMQTAFFLISGVLPQEQALALTKDYIKKTYIKKGQNVVDINLASVDKTQEALQEIPIPASFAQFVTERTYAIPGSAPAFLQDIFVPVSHLQGNTIPVSKMTIDGHVPLGTTKYEKRGIAETVPEWRSEKCIQCGICSFVCPHAAIRAKQIEPSYLEKAPATFKTIKSNTKNTANLQFKVQVYPEDCTGCNVCINNCPVKDKAIIPQTLIAARVAGENDNQQFFESLPYGNTDGADASTVKGIQFLQPMFEFSGACIGCGEAPYLRLATQLFGNKMVIANATGCTSIYGGTFPAIPYTTNSEGRGPAWANSLFEDNAEFGYGMRTAIDSNRMRLKNLIIAAEQDQSLSAELKNAFQEMLTLWESKGDDALITAKKVVAILPNAIGLASESLRPTLKTIDLLKDYLSEKSLWIVGGDGWAYDIGFGGLDHVLASGHDVNVLVLDTEMYSNTGGQASKSTPRGSVAKFAASGKKLSKKNLGIMMMSYGYIYVASVAMGADKSQLVKAMKEAASYPGPSIIIAYSPCGEHGIDLSMHQQEAKKAVESGYWPLFRFDPRLVKEGKHPLQLDSKRVSGDFMAFLNGEVRYASLQRSHPEEAAKLFAEGKHDSEERMNHLKELAHVEDKEQEIMK